jgi:hypothetical protein
MCPSREYYFARPNYTWDECNIYYPWLFVNMIILTPALESSIPLHSTYLSNLIEMASPLNLPYSTLEVPLPASLVSPQ